MFVTITSLNLRHWWGFFKLSLWGLKISRQAKAEKGFIEMKNCGFGYLHFTLSAWESKADAKNFARSGAHLEAMKESGRLATEIKVYTYESEEIPDWANAKRMLFEQGRVFSFANQPISESAAQTGGLEKRFDNESNKK